MAIVFLAGEILTAGLGYAPLLFIAAGSYLAALAWLQLLDNPDILVRFDIVEVMLAEDAPPRFELIRNAFTLPAPYIY